VPRTLWIALSTDPAQIVEACGTLAPGDQHHLIAPLDAVVDEGAWRAAGVRTLLRPRRLGWSNVRLRSHVRALNIERYVVISHGLGYEIEPLLTWWALGQRAEFLRFAPAWLPDVQRYERQACFWYTKREAVLNSDGFRGKLRDAPDGPGASRVACIGGSTTYGSGIFLGISKCGKKTPTPAYLEQLGGWQVLNLGLTGLGAARQSMRLLRYAAWRPDVVIVHAGYNDLPIVVGAEGDRYSYVVPISSALLRSTGWWTTTRLPAGGSDGGGSPMRSPDARLSKATPISGMTYPQHLRHVRGPLPTSGVKPGAATAISCAQSIVWWQQPFHLGRVCSSWDNRRSGQAYGYADRHCVHPRAGRCWQRCTGSSSSGCALISTSITAGTVRTVTWTCPTPLIAIIAGRTSTRCIWARSVTGGSQRSSCRTSRLFWLRPRCQSPNALPLRGRCFHRRRARGRLFQHTACGCLSLKARSISRAGGVAVR
jgi:hypothetical protein